MEEKAVDSMMQVCYMKCVEANCSSRGVNHLRFYGTKDPKTFTPRWLYYKRTIQSCIQRDN